MSTTPPNPYDAAEDAANAALRDFNVPAARAQRAAAQIATCIHTISTDGIDDTCPFELYYLVRYRLPSTSESAIRAAVIAWSSFNRKPVGDGTYR